MVGAISSEAPVVAAVLEQIPHRHRGVGEPVHEHRLQQALRYNSLHTVAGPRLYLEVVESPGGGRQVRRAAHRCPAAGTIQSV